MARESKSVTKFLDFIEESTKKNNSRPSNNIDRVCNYLYSLSSKELNKLFSDKYWVRYPFYTCWPNRTGRRSYGPVLGSIVNEVCQYNKRVKDALVNKSDGIFLSYTIDYTSGKDRLKASSRALKSKDGRSKLRAARVLPIRKVKGLVSDSNHAVRTVVLKRIGIDNCAESLLDDKSAWIRSKAIRASDNLSDEYIKEHINRLRNSKNPNDWYVTWELLALIQKLSDEELLYFLDLGGRFGRISEHIKKRLEYANIDYQQ